MADLGRFEFLGYYFCSWSGPLLPRTSSGANQAWPAQYLAVNKEYYFQRLGYELGSIKRPLSLLGHFSILDNIEPYSILSGQIIWINYIENFSYGIFHSQNKRFVTYHQSNSLFWYSFIHVNCMADECLGGTTSGA